MNVDRISRAS